MDERTRILLLQVRSADDPMRAHEVGCFARALAVSPERIRVFDLLASELPAAELDAADLVLMGGSGDYSAVSGGPWLDRALESCRRVHASGKPTFASCWGFQAMARALGGRVVNDPANAEIGTRDLYLTEEGKEDPIFGPLGDTFLAQMGHEDHVVELPRGATLLAVSERANQAYRFEDAPIYCTQFHPELRARDLVTRIEAYPRYVEMTTGKSVDRFVESLVDDPESEEVILRFVARFVDGEPGGAALTGSSST